MVTNIVDFFELPVFEQASTDSAITFLTNSNSNFSTEYLGIKTLKNIDLKILSNSCEVIVIKDEQEWKFIHNSNLKLLSKIENVETTIGSIVNSQIYLGIKTGLNKAFIISDDVKNILVEKEPKSKEIIKPLLAPTDFDSVNSNWSKKWIILSHNGISGSKIKPINIVRDYKVVFEYLKEYLPEIKTRGDQGVHWTNLRDCSYLETFYKPKISFVYTAKNHYFFFDNNNFIVNNSCFFISSNDYYLWAFLNSSLFKYYQKIKFVAYGDADGSGRVKLDRNKMLNVPIRPIKETELSKYEGLFKKIKEDNSVKTKTMNIIDKMIYKLYNLTKEEIQIIENSIK